MEKLKSRKKARRKLSRHHFTTKLSFVLTASTLALLGLLSIVYRHGGSDEDDVVTRFLEDASADDVYSGTDDNSNNGGGVEDYSQYSCRFIYDQVPDAGDSQCTFARTCNDFEGMWASSVFCSSYFGSYGAFTILSPIILLWMITLFRLLGSLEFFSVKLGLPPRFAGVTLLALGNGAADVSATISAITSDEENGYVLSLGALTGAAMFVGGVVSGAVIIAADNVPCRGALIRDVVALAITTVIVWTYLSTGIVTRSTTTVFICVYGVFVLMVLAADIYHRTVVLPRLSAVTASINNAESGGIGNGNELEETTSNENSINRPRTNAFMRFVTAVSNYDNNSSFLTNRQTAEANATMTTSTSVSESHIDPNVADEEPVILHGNNGILSGASINLEMERIGDVGGNYTLVEDHMDRVCVGEDSSTIPSYNWIEAIHNGKQDVMNEVQELWEEIIKPEYDDDDDDDEYEGLKLYERMLLFLEFPFTLLRKSTIPVPCEGYYNRGFVTLSMSLSPLWFAYYLSIQHDINLFSKGFFPYFSIYVGVSIFIGLLVLRFAPGGDRPMPLIAATPIALYGFIMAASMIDYIADNLVALLDFIGIVLHIPGSIMGLTILAWGNSMADLSANITMARKGLANMAMTACFAGPVFNILIGLGLAFRALENQTGKEQSAVSVSPTIITGFIFITINCIAILTFGCLIGEGRIKAYYGYIAVSLYAIYVITSITVELRS